MQWYYYRGTAYFEMPPDGQMRTGVCPLTPASWPFNTVEAATSDNRYGRAGAVHGGSRKDTFRQLGASTPRVPLVVPSPAPFSYLNLHPRHTSRHPQMMPIAHSHHDSIPIDVELEIHEPHPPRRRRRRSFEVQTPVRLDLPCFKSLPSLHHRD